MNLWQRCLRQPQRVWLRRAVFQIHLWSGLAVGLYIVVLSLTGSVLVYRNELVRYAMTPRPVFDADAVRLTTDDLRAAAERAYPGWEITNIGERVSRRDPTISVELTQEGVTKVRLFNPWTGEDLGDSFTRGERFVMWLVRLHDELLLEQDGRFWNAMGSVVVTVLVLTGAVVWWPGISRWRRSLMLKGSVGWRRFTWDLHSMLGAWLFLFMLMWGISGIYLGFSDPFAWLIDAIHGPDEDFSGDRAGDIALAWLARLHFGRWRNEWLKAAWAIVGLVPAMMFITGAVMWWNRVVRRRPVRDLAETAVRT